MEEKKGFVFLPTYYDAIESLPVRHRLRAYQALCSYALDGE